MTKLTILLLGVLTIATLAAAWENEDSSSLSEEMIASRQVRSPQRKVRKTRGKSRKSPKTKKTMKKGTRKSGKAKKTMKKGTRVQKKGTRVQKKGTRVQKKGTRKVAKKQMKPKTQKKATKKVTKTSKPETRQVADADTCFYKSIKAMRMLAGIVANFEKQQNRMKAHSKIASGKLDKKDAFESINQKLISAGGGNKSALSCSGSSTSPGAAQLANLTSVLGECQTVLASSCDLTTVQPNMTKMDACNASIVAFKTEAEMCLDMAIKAKAMTEEVCACFTAAELDEHFEANTDCKFPEETRNITAAKNKCVEDFGKCRKYEDDAATSITACSTSASALTEKVAALSENAAKTAEAQAVVKNLASSSRRMRRSERSLGSCTEVATTATTLITMVVDFPSSPDILVLSASIIASSTVVCTDDEISSLAALDAQFDEAAETFAEAIDSIQEQLISLTGSTVEPGVTIPAGTASYF